MKNPVTLRVATPVDKPALDALQRRASMALPAYRTQLARHPEVFDLPARQLEDGQIVKADLAGEPIGFAALDQNGETAEAQLDGLFVDPDYWRRGVGRRLVEAAAANARSRGCNGLSVVANPGAVDFYRRCGFEAFGEADTQFGTAITMRRAL